MKNVKKILLMEFVAIIVIAALVILIFELNIVWPGDLAGQTRTDFFVECAMVLLTIIMIPLALRLFKFKKIHNALLQKKEVALKKWGVIRILMLGLPMIANIVCYYLFVNPGYSYLALILFLSMMFVFPTLEKCYAETEPVTEPEKADEQDVACQEEGSSVKESVEQSEVE